MAAAPAPVDVAAIVDATELLYPPHLAEAWDRVGLVAGAPERPVSKVMVAVDPTLDVAHEAVAWGAQLLLVHHPLMLAGVHAIPADQPHGAVLTTLLENGCALLTAHTNADAAETGVSDAIATRLGLIDVRPLDPVSGQAAEEALLIVYVPATHVDQVIDAATKAGAGNIGEYSRCAFTHGGTGTFQASAGAAPFIGEPGQREVADELRVEMVTPVADSQSVVEAVCAAHPYEEPAVHLAQLSPKVGAAGVRVGIGRVGTLPGQHSVATFADLVARVMPPTAAGVRVAGDLNRPVHTVALCGGSGDSLLSAAAGYDVYLTSDLRHHRVLDHLAAGGCPVVDIAHWAAERPWCDQAVQLLPGALSTLGYAADSVEFRTSALPTDPWTAHRGSSQ